MWWTANKILVVSMLLFTVAILIITSFAPRATWNPTCYQGYRYNVDSHGIMWPIRVKGIVQKCQIVDKNVSR